MNKIISILTAAAALSLTSCGLQSPGNGEKVGQIVRLSKHGIFNETWEAQIIRGGFNNGSGVNGMAFDFTIQDENVVYLVREYMDNQKEVKIKYNTEGFYSLFRSDSGGDFLTSITEISGSNPSAEERKAAIKAKISELEKQLQETKESLNLIR